MCAFVALIAINPAWKRQMQQSLVSLPKSQNLDENINVFYLFAHIAGENKPSAGIR